MKKKGIMKKKQFQHFAIIILAITAFLISCNTNYTVNKKRGFFKIDFPEKKYQLYDQPGYPYSFEYPVYANIIKDSTFLRISPKMTGGLISIFRNSTEGFLSVIKK